jgi:hypothetical protein
MLEGAMGQSREKARQDLSLLEFWHHALSSILFFSAKN